MTLEDLVKVTVFVTRHEHVARWREIRDQLLGETKPASTMLVVASAETKPRWGRTQVEAGCISPVQTRISAREKGRRVGGTTSQPPKEETWAKYVGERTV